jgi:hypothetical protein
MADKPNKKFLYHAHTTALAGTLRKPFSEHIETQAGSALSVTGGVSNSRVEKFRHRDMLSCDAAYTTAVGHGEGGLHTTLVTATVEYLNILNMVTADRVVTRIASRHKLDGTEPSILTVGSHIDNLKIAGQPVEFEYDGDFLSTWDTFAEAKTGAASKPGASVHDGMIGASIVKSIKAPAGLTVENNRIHFPEFGSIYLGELYIWRDRRKLTMMRLVLGCSHDGDVTICDGDGNGGGFPP